MSEVRLLSLGNLRPYMSGDQSSFTLAEPFINSFLKIYLGREVMFGDIMSAETLFAITRCSYSNFKEKLVSRTRPNLEIALNTQKRPYLNQASKNYTCQRFLTKKFLETNWISNPKYPSIIPFTWVPPPPTSEGILPWLSCLLSNPKGHKIKPRYPLLNLSSTGRNFYSDEGNRSFPKIESLLLCF